jgi:hypothetical protein
MITLSLLRFSNGITHSLLLSHPLLQICLLLTSQALMLISTLSHRTVYLRKTLFTCHLI